MIPGALQSPRPQPSPGTSVGQESAECFIFALSKPAQPVALQAKKEILKELRQLWIRTQKTTLNHVLQDPYVYVVFWGPIGAKPCGSQHAKVSKYRNLRVPMFGLLCASGAGVGCIRASS